jgi:SAM-dependent methyltransferase
MSNSIYWRIIDETRPYVAKAKRLRGWSWEVSPTLLGPPVPWKYLSRARQLASESKSVLDIGTGGGEKYSQILKDSSVFAVATESWEENVPIAAKTLNDLGAQLVQTPVHILPFVNGGFDLVLSRHQSFNPSEIARVLKPGGHFLTQQVHGENWKELRRFFPRMGDPKAEVEQYQRGFHQDGLTIIQAQVHKTRVAFRNIGEIAYILTVTPWTVPGFDIKKDVEALVRLEKELMDREGIILTHARFMIEVQKGNNAG